MNNEEGIILSKKHGVNPSINCCVYCGKDLDIILFGQLKNDEEAPKKVCAGEICDNCLNRLIENKIRLYFDIETGRYVEIPDEYLPKEYLELVKDKRYFPLNKEQFDIIENANKQ